MPDIEPEEIKGLQDLVSDLKSFRNRDKLTIKDNPQNKFEWTIEECLKRSRSFNVFCFEVQPDYLDYLLPLCIELDFHLEKLSTSDYLTFNIGKHDKHVLYGILYRIWTDCFDSYTEKQWFYSFIVQNTNLANNEEAVRKGLDKHK